MTARPRWIIGAWLLFLLLCALVVARTPFTADLSAFLPRSPSPAQQLLVDQLRDGIVSRLILVGIQGAPTPALALLSRRLGAELRRDPRFVSADNGEDTAIEKDRAFLWSNRYLLSPGAAPQPYSATALHEALEQNLMLLGSPAGVFLQRILPNDPSGELMRLVERFSGQTRPETRDGVWFAPEGHRALLVAQTRAKGDDIDRQEEALGAIQVAFQKALAEVSESAGASLILTGPPVFSVNSRARIKGDATRLSLIATALIAALLLLLYRSPRVLVLGLLPVATGAIAGVASVGLAFGSVHGITLGFGATLIGEGVDYAIYLFSRLAPGVAAGSALDRIWPTLRLGVLTSICGFSAMLFSGFTGLAQLGLFSIVGLLVAVTVTRFVLPALVPASFEAHAMRAFAPRLMAIAQRAPALRYPVLLLIALTVGAAAVVKGPVWGDDLASLSPISAAEQKADQEMRRAIGAPDVRHLIVVSAPDEQRALQASERIAVRLEDAMRRGALGSFDSPALYLPSLATQHARQAALPSAETLRENLEHALRGLPFRPGLFAPFLIDVEKARRAPPLQREDLAGTRLALKLDSLLIRRGEGWTVMMPLRGVKDMPAIERSIAGVTDAEPLVLDLKSATGELYQAYRREALRNALIGAAAIVALLFVALRSPRRVLEVIAPLAAAVMVTASVFLLAGSPLSIFHLVGLLLVVAVGSNYSLFFERQAVSLQDRERTIMSLLFANLSTVIGFGLLSFSQVPVLYAIGATVGLGAVLSLVLSAILIARAARPAAAARP